MNDNSERMNYFDWVASQGKVIDYTDKESIKTLLKDCFPFIKPHLDNLFWVEANSIYLNIVHYIPQTTIAEYLRVSQLGISKRIRSGIKKLKLRLMKPENNMRIVRQDFLELFTLDIAQVIIAYYQMHNISMLSRIYHAKNNEIRSKINRAYIQLELINAGKVEDYISFVQPQHPLAVVDNFESLQRVCQKYYSYFQEVKSLGTVGDFLFKRNDRKRREAFDITKKD